jgi:hypothetical protein
MLTAITVKSRNIGTQSHCSHVAVIRKCVLCGQDRHSPNMNVGLRMKHDRVSEKLHRRCVGNGDVKHFTTTRRKLKPARSRDFYTEYMFHKYNSALQWVYSTTGDKCLRNICN